MWKLIIAGIILYYIVLMWRYRDNIFKSGKKENKTNTIEPERNVNHGSIVGKSNFRLGQVKPSEAIEGQISKPTDNAVNFGQFDNEDTPQPMDVEFEMEYEDNVENEEPKEEEVTCIEGDEPQSARGISFEEMAQAVQVAQAANVSEEEERKAVQTFSAMEQASLYDTVIEQINGGRLRVAEMLKKYDFVFVAPPAETTPEDLSAFDMNDYM